MSACRSSVPQLRTCSCVSQTQAKVNWLSVVVQCDTIANPHQFSVQQFRHQTGQEDCGGPATVCHSSFSTAIGHHSTSPLSIQRSLQKLNFLLHHQADVDFYCPLGIEKCFSVLEADFLLAATAHTQYIEHRSCTQIRPITCTEVIGLLSILISRWKSEITIQVVIPSHKIVTEFNDIPLFLQEIHAATRKPRDTAAVLFSLQLDNDIHYASLTVAKLRKPSQRSKTY